MDLGIVKKKALICGASKGIGRAIALTLAQEGADVFVCSRGKDALEELCNEIRLKHSVRAEYAACDLNDAADQQKLIEQVTSKFGGVDILIHNTGGPSPSLAADTSMAQWQQGFDQLFKAVGALNLAFLPGMKERNWGRIIAVTSLSVIEPIANLVVSNAIRSAVTAMLKTLSDEVANDNVTVNCVAPGAIQTGRIEDLIRVRAEKAQQSYEQYEADYIKAIPAGRMGTPEEFAAAVAFVASAQASYVTGSTICVDGGRRRSTY